METRVIIATKHSTTRSGYKAPMYWSIAEPLEDIEVTDKNMDLRDDIINLHWNHSKLPSYIKNILETSEIDESGFGIKQGKFKITIKGLDEDGGFKFSDIINLEKIT
jgi:hypothetical protein